MSKLSFLKEAIYRKCFSGEELEILSRKHRINTGTAMSILSQHNFEREILEERYYIKESTK